MRQASGKLFHIGAVFSGFFGGALIAFAVAPMGMNTFSEPLE
jgi:hypothetical protein